MNYCFVTHIMLCTLIVSFTELLTLCETQIQQFDSSYNIQHHKKVRQYK